MLLIDFLEFFPRVTGLAGIEKRQTLIVEKIGRIGLHKSGRIGFAAECRAAA
jgi:hypothetical protein